MNLSPRTERYLLRVASTGITPGTFTPYGPRRSPRPLLRAPLFICRILLSIFLSSTNFLDDPSYRSSCLLFFEAAAPVIDLALRCALGVADDIVGPDGRKMDTEYRYWYTVMISHPFHSYWRRRRPCVERASYGRLRHPRWVGAGDGTLTLSCQRKVGHGQYDGGVE